MILSADSVPLSELFNGKNLWLIPTFQRPYSWDVNKEAKQLFDDVIQASSRGLSEYYISPIHVIEVSKDINGKSLLGDYIDVNLGLDIDFITNRTSSTLLHGTTHSFKTYLVIDGQQRMLTSYIALYRAGRLKGIENITSGTISIPLIVPGSQEELAELQSQIVSSSSLCGTSRAARKIADLFGPNAIPSQILTSIAHFYANDVQLLRVVMDSKAALGSFLTLNDRGKQLTTLEKFKAHALNLYDIAAIKPSGVTTKSLNDAFCKVYRSLDNVDSVIDDEKVVQIFGCSNIGNMITQQLQAPEWGAKKWYESYIAIQPKVTSEWQDRLSAISDFNNKVVALKSANTLSNTTVLSTGRRIFEEIEVAFDRFSPNHRVLTIVHLIMEMYGISLVSVCGSINIDNRSLKNDLIMRLQNLGGQINVLSSSNSKLHLSSWLDKTIQDVTNVPQVETRDITLLQLAHMLNLINVKPSQFRTCITGILSSRSVVDALLAVEHYLTINKGREYILDFVSSWSNDRNSDVYRLVLDFEASKGRHWSLADGEEVEHIFASEGYASLGNASAYNLSLQSDYEKIVCSAGNILPLDKRLNASLGKKAPIDKASHYISQCLVSGASVVPVGSSPNACSPSAVEVGSRLNSLLYDYAAHRLLVELRTLELAAFALKTL